jgi:Sulfotransferase domain
MSKVFFHIGLPKTGTTTIQHVLKMDKQINLISTRHFNKFDYWEKPVDFIDPTKVNFISEENQILQMDGFGKFELFLSRVKKFSPDAHIILTIREQRDMMESRYKYQFDWHGGYTKSFNEWIRSGQGMDYLSICMYNTLLDSISTFFPKEQIHFLLFEDLKMDFAKFFQTIYSLIDLPTPKGLLDFPVSKNQSLSEPELSVIRNLNHFKIFKRDSLLAKYEFAVYKKIAAQFAGKEKKKLPTFRWDHVDGRIEIEKDFAWQNSQIAKRGMVNEESLLKYRYLLAP